MKRLFASLLLVVILFHLAGCASPTPQTTVVINPIEEIVLEPVTTLETVPEPLASQEIVLLQTPATGSSTVSPAEIGEKIDKFLTNLSQEQKLFTGIVLVAKNGEIVLHKGYGMVNKEENIPFDKDTIMPFGMGKSPIVGAVLLLNDEGRLNLSDRICQYIPDCPETWKDIVINDVIHSRSGIADPYEGLSDQEAEELWGDPDLFDKSIQIAREKPLRPINPPGTAPYIFGSPTEIAVMAEIIEVVTGETAQNYIKTNLLAPLGIHSIGENYTPEDLPKGYTNYGTPVEHDPFPDELNFPNFVVGTVGDIYALYQEFLSLEILSQTAFENLWQEETYYSDTGDYQVSFNQLGITKEPYLTIPEGHGAWGAYSFTEGYGFGYLISPTDQAIIILSTNERGRESQLSTMIKIILEWIAE